MKKKKCMQISAIWQSQKSQIPKSNPKYNNNAEANGNEFLELRGWSMEVSINGNDNDLDDDDDDDDWRTFGLGVTVVCVSEEHRANTMAVRNIIIIIISVGPPAAAAAVATENFPTHQPSRLDNGDNNFAEFLFVEIIALCG